MLNCKRGRKINNVWTCMPCRVHALLEKIKKNRYMCPWLCRLLGLAKENTERKPRNLSICIWPSLLPTRQLEVETHFISNFKICISFKPWLPWRRRSAAGGGWDSPPPRMTKKKGSAHTKFPSKWINKYIYMFLNIFTGAPWPGTLPRASLSLPWTSQSSTTSSASGGQSTSQGHTRQTRTTLYSG